MGTGGRLAHPTLVALGLSLGSALSLGLGRFSLALFIPPMSTDLGWNYFLAGFMNTGMALGYLIGALTVPALVHRTGATRAFLGSGLLTVVFLALSATGASTGWFLTLRVAAGITCAYVFSAGGVLVAGVAAQTPHRSGWLVGLYYGGVGIGIIAVSLIVPPLIAAAQAAGVTHPWQWGWSAVGVLALASVAVMWRPALVAPAAPARVVGDRSAMRDYLPMLTGYFCFGLGYIGYMTFAIALLTAMGLPRSFVIAFYMLLGVMLLVSPFLWARLLTRVRGGGVLSVLDGLLALAALVPAVIAWQRGGSGEPVPVAVIACVFASGMLFGACFMSAVASTTEFVKHNLPVSQWVAGISAFTSTFAVGQLIGPSLIGFLSDRAGTLAAGMTFAAVVLLVGSVAASRQRPLALRGQ